MAARFERARKHLQALLAGRPPDWLFYPAAVRYGLAVILTLVALILSLLLAPWFSPLVYFFFWPAAILSAWFGGLGPGLLATLLSGLAVNFFLRQPVGAFTIAPIDLLQMLVFAVFVGFISWLRERQRQAELALQQQRTQFQVTLEGIGDGVIATDTSARVTFMNPVAAALTGWTPDEAIGQPVQTVFHIVNEETRGEVESPVDRVLREGAIVGLANHTVLIARDGTERMITDSGAPIRTSEDSIAGAVLVFRDSTEQRLAEKALRDSNRRLEASRDTFRRLIHQSPIGVQVFDVNGLCTDVNQAHLDIFGVASREQLIGNYNIFADPMAVAVGTAEGVRRALAGETVYLGDLPFDFSVADPRYASGGGQRAINVSFFPVYDEENHIVSIVAHNQDMTRRKRAEERIALLQQLTAALSQAVTPEQVARVIVEQGFSALGAHLGVVAMLSVDGTILEIVNHRGVSVSTLQQFQTFPVDAPLPMSIAVRSRQPVWVRTFAEIQERYPALAERSQAADTHAFTCLPLLVENRVIGGVNMSFSEPQVFEEEDQRLMIALADQCAQALERALLYRAEEQALAESERARKRLAFLANVSVTLSRSLDYETTLANVANLVVPTIADWCRVDIVDEQGAVQLVSIAHVDPAKAAWIYSLQDRYPPNPEAAGGVHEVIRTGKPAYYPELPDAVLIASARDEEQLRIMREIGFKSVIIVPLILRDTCLGAVTFVMAAESGRQFSSDDVEFVQEIARRGAVAIENARLFAQARRTAVEEERQRLARELHDAVSQALFSANVMGEALPRLWQRNPEKAFEKLAEMTQLTRGAAAELRMLLLELRPEMLEKNRLTDLIAQLVEATKSRRRLTIACTFDGDYQPPAELHAALFRITQEALNNVVKHSQATRGEVVLKSAPSGIELKIIDNGRGFALDDTASGFGIVSMRERAQAVKATLELVSEIGKGTEVRVMWQPQAPAQ